MKDLSQIWFQVQHDLFPYLEKEFKEPLTPKLMQLISILEIVKIENFIRMPRTTGKNEPRRNAGRILKEIVPGFR